MTLIANVEFVPALWAAGACVLGVALEGLFAGGDIRTRLKELRQPRFVPPLWGWIVIGVFYYIVCFGVLYRLLSLGAGTPFRTIAVVLALAFMFGNALWNWFFFRARNLFHSLVIGSAYSVLALVLFACLWRADRFAAAWLAPYVAYLAYANLWGYQLWKLNR